MPRSFCAFIHLLRAPQLLLPATIIWDGMQEGIQLILYSLCWSSYCSRLIRFLEKVHHQIFFEGKAGSNTSNKAEMKGKYILDLIEPRRRTA